MALVMWDTIREQPNARHHPPAHKMEIDDRQRVAGRVHAVVRLRLWGKHFA
jgi:hypothetical protein